MAHRRLGSRSTTLAVAFCAVGAFVTVAAPAAVGDAAPLAVGAAYEAVEPCRLFDSRESGRRLQAGEVVEIAVSGRCGVESTAVAAAITVTAVAPSGSGHVAAYPAGETPPTASTLNYRTGQTVANAQLTRLGAGGAVSVSSFASSDIVVDVSGFFVAAPDGASSGRFVPVAQQRLIDTRETGRPAPGAVVNVASSVPKDAVAAAVNITTTATNGADHFTAFPAGGPIPNASVLNVDGADQTRAASMLVPLAGGAFDVFTLNGNHIIVDITGYFTGPSAPVSSDGLFIGVTPTRLVDTRLEHGPNGGPRLWDHGTREFDVAAITGGSAGAIAANVTVVDTEAPGHVTMYPARTAPPPSSTVNYDAGQRTVANLAVTSISSRGLAVEAHEATHLVIDVTGWFIGEVVPSTGPPAPNQPPPPRRVTIIGDSAMAGVRWNGALGGLQGFDAVTRLESCRRLVQSSCRGREGHVPLTARDEILTQPQAGPEEILVIAVGYNDWHARFSADFDAVVGAATSKGYRHVMWVTYRSGVGYTLPGTGGTASNYGEMNRVLREKVASGAFPEVRLWDLDTFAGASVGWFTSDGVHQTRLGSWGVADWLSRHVRAFDDVSCMQPWRVGVLPEPVCQDPDPLPAAIGLPDIAAVYGL